jgi:putative RNA 2'-phosphotransferase
MDEKRLVKISKYLSKHLRHDPERLGLRLEPGGWVAVEKLLAACAEHAFEVTPEELREVVERNDKQRFAFDPTGTLIRANQGHSTPVDLQLASVEPPPLLYHGTAETNLDSIFRSGLDRRARHHVHLYDADSLEAARAVGMRHGKPVILVIAASVMRLEGFTFHRSENGVWLVDHVPPQYLSKLD